MGALPIPTAFSATGGTKTTSGSNVIHSFTSPGTFTVDNAPPTFAVEYLMVGGGGGGGSGSGGAGGGAGGYRCSVPGEASGGGDSAESTLTVVGATNYTITVGAGGAGATNAGSGGSGVVITKQPAVNVKTASSCWDLRILFKQLVEDDWV